MPDTMMEMGSGEWERLIRLAHDDRARVFEDYSSYYLKTHGQLYWSDTHQMSVYLDDYHTALDQESCATVPASEMISELYVPRDALVEFMSAAASLLRQRGVPVIYGTVRLIQRDAESFLAWAREDFACVIFNLHTEHDEAGIARSAAAFRALIDEALALGGSFFLTYHRWARRDQIERAYPQFAEFLRHKEAHDPDRIFQSEWWRHHQDLFAAIQNGALNLPEDQRAALAAELPGSLPAVLSDFDDGSEEAGRRIAEMKLDPESRRTLD
jgi:FAD/FMN-containing dehydrogenase